MSRILIAGAGIAGLSLVRALRGLDAEVELVERLPTFAPVGAGIVLHPNGMDALARLGFLEAILSAGNVLRYLELNRGASSMQIALSDVWRGAAYPTISIYRPKLHEILAEDLSSGAADYVSCVMGRRVVSVDESSARPRARFDDGSTEEYDLIVAADGVHSAIRRALFPLSPAKPTHLHYYRFPARNVLALPSDTWRTQERLDASYGYIPMGPEHLHCFIQIRNESALDQQLSGEECVRTTFCPWDDELRRTFEARTGPVHVGLAHMVSPTTWGRGACVFLGDAAHAISPTFSEGGALAIEDALVLGSALKKAATLSAGIEAFIRARTRRVLWAQRMALSQVNAYRRPRVEWNTSPAIAQSHLRQMYLPLLRSSMLDGGEEDPATLSREETSANREGSLAMRHG